MCLRRRDEDCLHHHRLPSGRSDSQTPAQSGVPRPGPVRAARATVGRRQFLAMISNEGSWSFRTISLPSSDAPCVSVCESGAPNFARICWGEREYFRGKVHGTCFPPAEPGFIAQQASHLSAGLSRLSLALEIECQSPIVSLDGRRMG